MATKTTYQPPLSSNLELCTDNITPTKITPYFDRYLTNTEAANLTGFTERTLKMSRHTGALAGVQSPTFIKVGRSVRYKVSDLLAWMDQFKKYSNTAQQAADSN